MNIHFVAQSFDYSFLTPDARRIDIADEHHDPLSGIINFHSFFDRIDGRGKREVLWLDSERVKKAFWDRDEFVEALRQSRDDVYVQASDYYSARIMFLNQQDHEAFVERLGTPRVGFSRTFDEGLHGEIRTFLRDQCAAVHDNDWIAVLDGDNHIYTFRDETVAGLVEIKFSFTERGDHSKPIPSLEKCREGVIPIAA